ncbi:hypothetical protein LCGC14_1953030 [marine sediment metagenome]|uniref:Uncharacterized protein n=1 Tax=marine sediment metagenome TaxID=412755 RepID=A0A0F9FGS8_9ZZZZ
MLKQVRKTVLGLLLLICLLAQAAGPLASIEIKADAKEIRALLIVRMLDKSYLLEKESENLLVFRKENWGLLNQTILLRFVLLSKGPVTSIRVTGERGYHQINGKRWKKTYVGFLQLLKRNLEDSPIKKGKEKR